ncbi:MAG: ATP-binding protein [Bacteroidota bacterium]
MQLEIDRLAALHRSGLLDTPPEERFDRITRLAARIFDAPISLVTLLDEHRQFFKSHYGLDVQETGRDVSFCAYTLETEQPLVVEDARLDSRFVDNALVMGGPGIRAYAGVPIRSADGYILGALSIIDREPRIFSEDEIQTLAELAGIVSDELARTREARQQLDHTQLLVDRMVTAIPGILYVLDIEQGRLTYINPNVDAHLGYSADELIGCEPDALRSHLDQDELLHPGAWGRRFTELAHGEALRLEFRARHRDGTWRWLDSRNVVFTRSADGTPVDILGIAVDITERKRYQTQLIKAKQQAEELAHLKGSILANMSHEIRTPLTGIIGFSELALADAPEGMLNHMRIILRNAHRLRETLTSVLDIARLEANEFAVDKRAVDIASEIKDVTDLLEPVAQKKQLSLRLELDTQPLMASVDPAAFHRIANNLIGNAIKFTEEGNVTVSLRRLDDTVELQVADTGVGIDPSFLPHIFDAFRQESAGEARSHEGSGLGLYLTRHLVDMLGGHIHVWSEKGKGSTFTVVLPAA